MGICGSTGPTEMVHVSKTAGIHNEINANVVQGSQNRGKSWKTWSMEKAFPDLEKSWNLKIYFGEITKKIICTLCMLYPVMTQTYGL